MKIVLIDRETTGGIAVYNRRLFSQLKLHHHDVTIIRFSKEESHTDYIHSIPYYWSNNVVPFLPMPSEHTYGIIKNYLQEIQPDIVYTCIGLSPFDFFLPKLCHDLNIPLVGIWHIDYNDGTDLSNLVIKSAFNAYLNFCQNLDLLHVFSPKLKEFYIDKGIDEKKIVVIPNGVDSTFFKSGKSEYKEKHHIKIGVLFIGRLTLQKNPETLIKSFLSLDPPETTKLILMGEGDKGESLREKYVDKRVIFLGEIKDEDLKKDIINACDLFVLPSRFEGMSLALLEAMSSGLACVATDVGSTAEVLDKVGILIDPKNISKQLPLVLSLLINYPEMMRFFGQKARERVIEKYREEKIFSELIEELEKTIKNYHRADII